MCLKHSGNYVLHLESLLLLGMFLALAMSYPTVNLLLMLCRARSFDVQPNRLSPQPHRYLAITAAFLKNVEHWKNCLVHCSQVSQECFLF